MRIFSGSDVYDSELQVVNRSSLGHFRILDTNRCADRLHSGAASHTAERAAEAEYHSILLQAQILHLMSLI